MVTADDVGLTEGLNRGAERLIAAGRLANVSLLVNAPATEDAAARLRAHPEVSVGLHFNLYQGPPLSKDRAGLAPLLGPDGEFLRVLRDVVRAFRGRPILRAAVEAELDAQLDRFAGLGLSPSHIDIHKFLAGTPVWSIIAGRAAARGIPFVRWPVEPLTLLSDPFRWSFRGYATALAITGWTRARCRVPRGVRTMPCAGIACIGEWNEGRMEAVLRGARHRQLEIVMHPGEVGDGLERSHTRLVSQRQDEMTLLLSDRFGALLERYGWRVAGFRDCA
ncbi:MAG: carbohydrate deacetylase [Planctomycetaceae bacterium]